MKKIIVLMLLAVQMVSYSETNTLNKYVESNILIPLDSCLPLDIRNKMVFTDENSFMTRSPFIADTISFRECETHRHCFDIIDSVFVNDTYFRKQSGTLLFEFKRLVTEIIYRAYYQHLNNLPLTFEHDLDSLKEIKRVYDSTRKAWETADSINGVYIPKNLDEALDLLDSLVPEERINEFKSYKDEDKAVYSEYFGLGTYLITNVWKAGSSRLHYYFVEKGIYSHDAIKVLILRSWYRRLNNKPIKFEEQIEKELEYEKKNKKNIPSYMDKEKK